MNKTIGLIINPIAGMGGSVGLKGTDGTMAQRARELGATPVTPGRVRAFLKHLAAPEAFAWIAAPGRMGADSLIEAGIPHTVIGHIEATTHDTDTRHIAQSMLDAGVDLLVVAGGDGTACDLVDAVGVQIPVIGIPSGVKVYSAAFALSPTAAAHMLESWADGAVLTEQEVVDIDEDAFRADQLSTQHHGWLLVPNVEEALQPGKEGSRRTPALEENLRDIAGDIVEAMEPGVLYLFGPGTTVRAITDELGVGKTLLGVDAVVESTLIARDLNEQAILELLEQYPQRRIVVTPLGGNGYIFGRGNKQFTPDVLRRVGREQIIIVAAEAKLQHLRELRVDTGDDAIDQLLDGYINVVVGYHLGRVVKIKAV